MVELEDKAKKKRNVGPKRISLVRVPPYTFRPNHGSPGISYLDSDGPCGPVVARHGGGKPKPRPLQLGCSPVRRESNNYIYLQIHAGSSGKWPSTDHTQQAWHASSNRRQASHRLMQGSKV